MTEEPMVTVRMTKADAERISHGLSDLLCWHAGYGAACRGVEFRDTSDDPMGRSEARDINCKIKDALNDLERKK